ncbi:dipeptide/oligopeptide/nickel ABC transporter permease/ATP-binding protein [Streptomyces prunicolor]|uniref:dipeptide/oligopeptide/nickel ABC transporter permease/ATP-binding protein n=1 Tax=Streptomyces prunicolor TaxID=67348 RepID=UPI0022580F08|nr:dipeptide/oligopeptide/nickel ABC transporter permease/ATP-binding protein [Streptomyces prunicolor]MCX5241347.1 dipeptide/oligopeptide/nickel ABC transporter permease/ATP-binding protein [Streptomyces prunicolor]
MSTPQVPFLRRALGRPRILIPAVILVVELIASFGASLLAPYPPQQADFAAALSGPSAKHLLGTDRLGRDVLSRLMYGGADTFREIAIAVLITLVIAVPLGLVAGLRRGRVDAVLMRLADVVMSIPGIILLLIVLALFSQSMTAAMIVIGLLSVPGMMRVVRSASLTVGRETYVAAARVSGLGTWRVARRHVLPRITGLILVNAALACANTLLIAAGLNAIGLGVKPPAPSWGGMMADAAQTLNQSLWLAIPTGGLVAVTAAALIVLGDGLRDMLAERWSGTSHTTTTRRHKAVAAAVATVPAPQSDDAWLLAEPQPVVRLTKVTVTAETEHGEVELISDVSLAVGQGRTVGLVGESGCGKSMTGLALLGLLPNGARVSSGTVEIDGVDVGSFGPDRWRALRGGTIAFISQEPMVGLDPLFTIGQLLREAVRTHEKLSRKEAALRARELLAQVQLPDPDRVLKLGPSQISGGMAQRVSIAVALAGRPRVLVADEPTTALDVTVQREIVQLLRTIQRDTGMALLMISHDWDVIAEACDTALVMYAGQVVEAGPTERVMTAPLHPYTRKLLAANPRLATVGEPIPTIPGTVPPPGQWPVGCHFADRCPDRVARCTEAPIALTQPDDQGVARCVLVGEELGEELLEVSS